MKFVKILDGIDNSWSNDEIARYLYVNIAKNVRYDERFEHGKNPEALQKIYDRQINEEEDEQDTRVTCASVNKIFSELLTKCDIPNQLVYKNAHFNQYLDVPSVGLIYETEDGTKRMTNLIGDLANCIYGSKTRYFGIDTKSFEEGKETEEISLEELKEIRERMQDKVGMTASEIDHKRVVVGMATCGIASGA